MAKEKAKGTVSIGDMLSNLSAAEVNNFKVNPRINVPFADLWILGSLTLGKKIAIIGKPGNGKSTLAYYIIGSLLRTCKQCNTQAINWQNEEGTKSAYTCKCGKNDFMNVVLMDNELRVTPEYLRSLKLPVPPTFQTYNPDADFMIHWGENDPKVSGRLFVLNMLNVEAVYRYVCSEMQNGKIHAFVCDALNSIPNRNRAEQFKIQIGDMAKSHAEGLKNLMAAQIYAMKNFNFIPTVIWTNHLTMQIGATPFDTKPIEAGGFSPKFYEDQCIDLYYAKNNPDHIVKDGEDKQIASEHRFSMTKSVTGMFENVRGDYSIFQRPYMLRDKGFYEPGDTFDNVKLFKWAEALSLKKKEDKFYTFLGKTFDREKQIYSYLKREDIQMEAKFWAAKTIGTPLARTTLLEEDYLYSPFRDETKIDAIRQEVDAIINTNNPSDTKNEGINADEVTDEEAPAGDKVEPVDGGKKNRKKGGK